MPAQNWALKASSSMSAIKLIAYQRNPFMRQIQTAHDTNEPHTSTSKHSIPDRFPWRRYAGTLSGTANQIPAATVAAKKSR